MFKLLVVLACARFACGAEPVPESDPMLEALWGGGAARAAVCADAAGCAGALWARHWLLARASCLARAPRHVHRAPVLLYHGPQDCRAFLKGELHVDALEALARFVHPAYSAPASDDAPAPAALGRRAPPAPPAAPAPHDAALVLLAAPAPLPRADNYSATYALLPELSSWVRYVPLTIPWSVENAPAAQPSRLDPALVPLLDSPLRVLAATVLLPAAALLAGFSLLLRAPAPPRSDRETLLVAQDAPEPDDSV